MSSRRPTDDERDQLIKAAEEGNISTLQHLIVDCKLHVDTRAPRKRPHWNRTLLLISCYEGHFTAVEKLLQLGADINAIDESGWTALHCAAYNGHSAVAELLLRRRPELISQTDKSRWTALHCAAYNGHSAVVDLLLNRQPNLISQTDKFGATSLDYAVMGDNSDVVWTLIHNHKGDITQCREFHREKAKRLLAAEEARRAKSKAEKGSDDTNMKLAYSYALKFGMAISQELQILMVGAENSGKSCLIASFLGEAYIEGQIATDGADTQVCKIYCKNWSRMNISDMTMHLHDQFISQFKQNALKAVPSRSNQESFYPSRSEKMSTTEVPLTENLPSPHPKDVQEASSYTPPHDPHTLNAVVWDFPGQVIFHNTNSIFISESGVPVITFNASMTITAEVVVREGATPPAECRTIIESIHYWLQVVDSMCSVKGSDEDHSPLLPTALLAGTHIDKLHDDIKEARKIAKKAILPVLEEELLGKPYARHLAGIKDGIKSALEKFCFFLSNKCRDEEIDRLKDVAIAVAGSLRKEQPIFFLKIEQSLLLQKEQIISKSKMAEIVAESSFSLSEDSPEFKGVLDYFHTKRAILHFSQIKSLKNLVILSPRWLAKLFSYVITAHSYITGTELDDAWRQLTKYGLLHENLLVHMLEKFLSDYPIAVHVTKQQVVDILLCFHLVALISRDAWFAETGFPSIPESGDTFIVPSLVPRDETKTIPYTEKERIIYFKFNTGFIPTSVLNQLIADCICRNVNRKDQLLWMRHGKVALQLGAHQKYYISRSEEKQSIQLTITVSKKDVKCMQERSALINDVTKMLDDIMKVFMPAARKPTLFVHCPLCDVLHITLQQICDGVTVHCPSSTDDTALDNYYSDLLSVAVSKQPNYRNLIPYFDDVTNWKQLGAYLLPEKYASKINDIDEDHKQDVQACRWALITEYLKVGEVSWKKVIYALEKSGHPNIAKTIRGDMFDMDDVTTKPLIVHERHEQSRSAIASDTDVSPETFTDHKTYQQSRNTAASVTNMSNTDQEIHKQSIASGIDVPTKLLTDHQEQQQPHNTAASVTNMPTTDDERSKQLHHTNASQSPQSSTEKYCLVM